MSARQDFPPLAGKDGSAALLSYRLNRKSRGIACALRHKCGCRLSLAWTVGTFTNDKTDFEKGYAVWAIAGSQGEEAGHESFDRA